MTLDRRGYFVKYNRANRRRANTGATNADIGQAGEYLVAFDLLRRGLKVTKPINANGPDDLYAKTGGGWRSVQVKLGTVNSATGTISRPRGQRILSDVLALVDAAGGRIRYIAKNIPELPEELKDPCPSTSTSVLTATAAPSESLGLGN